MPYYCLSIKSILIRKADLQNEKTGRSSRWYAP